MNRLILIAGIVVLGACGFEKELPSDASGPVVMIGFDAGASTADEKSSMFPITVRLSDVTTHDVTVKYQVAPGPNVDPSDFDLVTPESFTIAAGQLTTDLFIKIKADTNEEGDEHLELVLLDPVGAEIALASSHHDLTIRAKALPRVSFEEAGSQAQEPTDATFNVKLDDASEFDIIATYTVTSTNAIDNTDYILANGMVTFTPGVKMMPLTLDVLDDALDEDDESVVVTLTSSTNSLVDNLADKHTHVILDTLVDPPPTVQFGALTSTQAEGDGAVTIAVTLSAASGRTIQVPYTVDNVNSNATGGGTDYTLAVSPLTIAPGATTGTIALTIVQDTTDEPTETVEIDMNTAVNATNTGNQTHRMQITDDDQICYGAAPFAVCFDSPPQGALVLPATINTGTSGLCATTQPTGWTTAPQSQPAACFIARDTITISSTVTVQGTRPLVLVGASSITVSATLDASSNNTAGSTGPASSSSVDCNGLMQVPDGSVTGGGGGGGGSFMSIGGNGGTGDAGASTAGVALAASAVPTKLRGGCNGQRGGNGSNGAGNASGAEGRGGGDRCLRQRREWWRKLQRRQRCGQRRHDQAVRGDADRDGRRDHSRERWRRLERRQCHLRRHHGWRSDSRAVSDAGAGWRRWRRIGWRGSRGRHQRGEGCRRDRR